MDIGVDVSSILKYQVNKDEVCFKIILMEYYITSVRVIILHWSIIKKTDRFS